MEISTDRARLDRERIFRFLSEESYWARGTTRERVEAAIEGSLCFGAYEDDGALLAFARVVTDGATFGFLADVFVVPEARGAGVGKALVDAVMSHPQVERLNRVTLATLDAHALYAQYGFTPLDDPERWMIRRRAPRP
jgi:GNAT superfamily N-acetyltransferase